MEKKTRIRATRKTVKKAEEAPTPKTLESTFGEEAREEPKTAGEPVAEVYNEAPATPMREDKAAGEPIEEETSKEDGPTGGKHREKEKEKVRFSRASLIFVSLAFFYALFALFAAICIDPNSTMVLADNPLASIRDAFGLPIVNPSLPTWIAFVMLDLYLFVFLLAIAFEERLAKYYGGKAISGKMIAIYAVTFIACFGLAFGIGALCHYDFTLANFQNSLLFAAEAFLVGLVVYLIVLATLFFLVVLIVNIKNWSKPYSKGIRSEAEEEEAKKEALDAAAIAHQGNLAGSFGTSGAAGGAPVAKDSSYEEAPLGSKERVFPGLSKIDLDQDMLSVPTYQDDKSLSEICEGFRNYLAGEEHLYYDPSAIRSFIAGLSASRLIILEGLSGTGKSSLARYFGEYIGCPSFFAPVQATWRDRTSLLGFYNDFSRTYNETEFLKRLYSATYAPEAINVMVLDEMNISRIEYYFADFLSIMEYPMGQWILPIMQLPYDFDAPAHLEDGKIHIPATTWFIGTANKDDSTYTITDKVYDRAIVLSFDDRNEAFGVEGDYPPISISYDGLMKLFTDARKNKDFALTRKDLEPFLALSREVQEAFDVTYGNRIYNQIASFVPVYCACGGTKEEALDFMFARKVLRKLEGRFEDYVREALKELLKSIEKFYGKDGFKESKALVRHYLKRFGENY